MILEANLAVAQVQRRGMRSVSAFNPACHIKLLTARCADALTPRAQRIEKSSIVTSVPEQI
jgi:hypothetical protein